MPWYQRNKKDGNWEKEVPELTEEQLQVQNEILFNLGRSRRNKNGNTGTNYIDSSYSVGAWVYDINLWELDSLASGDFVDSSDI